MLVLFLSLGVCALYFFLAPYSLGVIFGNYEIFFNPALLIVAFVFSALFGFFFAAQCYAVRETFKELGHQRLYRKLALQQERLDFQRQATDFFFFLESVDSTPVEQMKDSYYRPSESFDSDTKRWRALVLKKDFEQAYQVIKKAEPYVPSEYIRRWLVKTLRAHLQAIEQPEQLRRLLRKMPHNVLWDKLSLEMLFIKLALFESKKERADYLKDLDPLLIDSRVESALWHWMCHDCPYWSGFFAQCWTEDRALSEHCQILLVKLALGSNQFHQAKIFIEQISSSQEKAYFQQVLSLQEEKGIFVLQGPCSLLSKDKE